MTYLTEMNEATGLLDGELAKKKGLELRQQYLASEPFPHIAIDEFLPTALLDRCLADFPGASSAEESFDRGQERLKRSFSPDRLPMPSRQLFYAFNSRPFIQIIENVTGIKGLIPDPHFLGGGFHEIAQGGHLSVHADFNHHIPMNLERRINVLIYLNRNWKDAYGSQLELWDVAMTRCVKSYVPLFNRCVIFNTTSLSNHGNPQPVQHPDAMPRRSIALYYYTATWDGTKRTHTTQFRVRPESEDQPTAAERAQSLAQVFTRFPRLKERRTQLAGTLSGGERQMLAMGRALMGKPRLLMLDEPSLGLAPLIVRDIFEIIVGLKQTGVSILLVEQNARAALQVADHAYVMELGEITAQGPASQLAADPRIIESYLGLGGTA